ncbi:MAG: hypothetical protein LBL36_02450 [Clostridiales Family XIII bacterium]|jgi:hypothetical protein|nr:hypothetical protein [Clostridiales Family XIII bacterium]
MQMREKTTYKNGARAVVIVLLSAAELIFSCRFSIHLGYFRDEHPGVDTALWSVAAWSSLFIAGIALFIYVVTLIGPAGRYTAPVHVILIIALSVSGIILFAALVSFGKI